MGRVWSSQKAWLGIWMFIDHPSWKALGFRIYSGSASTEQLTLDVKDFLMDKLMLKWNIWLCVDLKVTIFLAICWLFKCYISPFVEIMIVLEHKALYWSSFWKTTLLNYTYKSSLSCSSEAYIYSTESEPDWEHHCICEIHHACQFGTSHIIKRLSAGQETQKFRDGM